MLLERQDKGELLVSLDPPALQVAAVPLVSLVTTAPRVSPAYQGLRALTAALVAPVTQAYLAPQGYPVT